MKKYKFILSITTILTLSIILISCSGNNQKNDAGEDTNDEKVNIIHSLGTTQVNKNPQRVVVLDFSALENLDYLGIKPVAVPKTGLPGHLSKYNDPSIVDVGSITEVNLEKINEVQPDLIIMGQRLLEFYDQLSVIAPVIYPAPVDAGNFVESFEKNLDDMALLFGKKNEADEAKAEIRYKIEATKSITANSDEKALILLHNRGRFSAYGSGSRFGIVHDVFGVSEAAEGLSVHRHGNPVSSEYIQKVNPDIIFIIDRSRVVDNSITNKQEIENPLIKETNAAKNDKIYYLNPEIWYLAGGGIISVNEMIEEVTNALDK
ncbi:MAG: siderophore ABC transporter substrate-binding protein [Fermentimonas sp.]|nr:siderophore ABC transporter substrate-binding protein [Fermentimonas sp.]